MREHAIELSLRRWFEECLNIPEEFSDRVFVHWAGEPAKDNHRWWVVPRIDAVERAGPRDDADQFLTFTVQCIIKAQPEKKQFGELALLVDEVRRCIDATLRSSEGRPKNRGAAKLYNRENKAFAIIDFGPAQTTRTYGTSVSFGGITLTGVDLAVLSVRVQMTELLPRVCPTT